MEDNAREYLLLLAEEYKSLRDESKQVSINMFAALRWGAAVVGVVIAAGFTQWNEEPAVVLLIFYVVVPVLSVMSMFLWIGEAVRFKRVGDYICFIEQKAGMILDEFKSRTGIREKWEKVQREMEENLLINHTVLDMSDPLVWEQWLRDMKGKKGKSATEGHVSWIYRIRLSFFPLAMVFSFLTATYYVFAHPTLVPPLLQPLERFMPDTRTGVLLLMVVWFVIFISTMEFMRRVARKLDINTNSIIRARSVPK